MNEILDQEMMPQSGTVKRPVFLTVLCILTFIGVGLTILSQAASYIAFQSLTDAAGTLEELGSSPEIEAAKNALRYVYVFLAVGIGGSLLCLLGAIMMWKLKRLGYYIYIAGQVIPVVISFALQAVAVNVLTIISSVFLPVLFIVLYGVNFRHLK